MDSIAEPFDGVNVAQLEGLFALWSASGSLAAGIPGMTGNCLAVPSGSSVDYFQQTLAAGHRMVFSGRLRMNALESMPLLITRNGSQNQVELWNTASGYPKVRRLGSSATDVASDIAWQANVAVWVELVVDLHSSAGNWWLYIGDQLAASETNVATAAAGVTTGDNFKFGRYSSGSGTYWYDDLVFQTGDSEEIDRLLDCQLRVLAANGDHLNTNFTPSTGSDLYPLVADALDTTYVAADTAGDEFACDLADETVLSYVHWVEHDLRVQEEAAASRQVKSHLMQGSAHGYGAAKVCGTAAAWKRTVHRVDPTDNAAWSIVKVNSLKAGAYIES